MSPEKIDYPPLLPAGFHPLTLESLEALAVIPFGESVRRRPLYDCLKVFVELLRNTGLLAELWLDGSFMSEKLDPDDVDLVVAYDLDSSNGLSAEQQAVLGVLLNPRVAKERFGIHLFTVRTSDLGMKAYWRGFLGFQRDEVTPKGIGLMKVTS